MAAFDYKKEYKELYLPKEKPCIVDVPAMRFIMVDGKGDPNTSPLYKEAVEVLYSLSYSIKMSKKSGTQPEGYFDYVVPPLEGLWWFEDNTFDGSVIGRKDEFSWVMMIRVPEFVTPEVFATARESVAKKKPGLDTSKARLEERVCARRLCTSVPMMMSHGQWRCWRSLFMKMAAAPRCPACGNIMRSTWEIPERRRRRS